MGKTIRRKRFKNQNDCIREKKMPSYTPTPSEWKHKLYSSETQKRKGESTKKTQNKKDIINAANRSRKKAVRRIAKQQISKELNNE